MAWDDGEKNAIVKSVRFDTERGLTLWVELDYGGGGQCFGGWMLYGPKGWKAHGSRANYCGHFVYRLLEVVGVSDLQKMVGKAVRARVVDGLVVAIGNIIEDSWFEPKSEFAELEK